MTVCVAVCVHDGIVFAADSATSIIATVGANSVISNVYNHGNKVFSLYRGLPLCAMTAGIGSIGNAPIHALIKDLRRLFRAKSSEYHLDLKSYTVGEVAVKIRKFIFEEKYKALEPPIPPPHSFELWVGGYSAGSEAHELRKITIENGECGDPAVLRNAGECGINYGGQPQAINRLLVGFDESLSSALHAAGVAETDLPQLLAMIQARSQAHLYHPAMPIQDAIDLASFLVDTTKGFVRFSPGAGTVGGETDIATVTRHERFKWIKRKHYYPPQLNPLETDHDYGEEEG